MALHLDKASSPAAAKAHAVAESGFRPGAPRARHPLRGRLLVGAVPPLATLVITLWGATGSSYWRDEAATMVAAERSLGDLLRMLGNVDADHGAYYLLMWVVVRVGGTGELVTRLPSALAMAAAAALVAAMGRRLVSPRAGLAAGLVFAVLPSTSLFAQDARPDAFAVALAAGASYLLVRVLQSDRSARRWLVAYAACVAALGLVDVLGLFLLGAHAATVSVAAWRRRGKACGHQLGGRALAGGWLAASIAGLVVASPVVLLSYSERAAVGWIAMPHARTLLQLPTLLSPLPRPRTYDAPFAAALVALILVGLVASLVGGRTRLAQRWPLGLAEVSLPWLVLPGALLFAVSFLTPLYFTRYLMFCVPAFALLAGTAVAALSGGAGAVPGRPAGAAPAGKTVAALGSAAGAAALLAVALLGLPAQLAARQPNGHDENIRLADRVVAANMHRGDAVLFHNPSEESLVDAYPYGFAQLWDVGQAQSPARSGTLTGTFSSEKRIRWRLAGVPRVWVVVFKKWTPPRTGIRHLGLRYVRRWVIGDIRLYLYARGSGR